MKRMYVLQAAAVACLLHATPAWAQTASPPPFVPLHIPTPSGEVILPTENDKHAYDDYGYAALRRAA